MIAAPSPTNAHETKTARLDAAASDAARFHVRGHVERLSFAAHPGGA